MTTSIADVRDVIKTAVETTGLRAYAYIQDAANVPCAHVAGLEFDPRLVFGEGKVEMTFQVRVYVNRAASVESNQKLLDLYRDVTGPSSLVLAIQEDDNWGGGVTIDYLQVTRIGEVNAFDYGGAVYLGFDLDVEACW